MNKGVATLRRNEFRNHAKNTAFKNISTFKGITHIAKIAPPTHLEISLPLVNHKSYQKTFIVSRERTNDQGQAVSTKPIEEKTWAEKVNWN